MKQLLSLLSLFVLIQSATAQKVLPEYGVPDPKEMQLKSCAFEPDANAMVLFDIQEMEYEPSAFGGKIVTEKRVRIKIFNEKGYSAATIRIPYYSKKNNTKIKDLRGIIYNTDAGGNIVTQVVEEEDFYKQKAMERIGVINFTFPNLKPGSVIEYAYTLSEKDRIQFDPRIYQGEIPAAFVSTTLITPGYSHVNHAIFGNDSIEQKGDSFKKGGYERHRRIYQKENIRSFTSEPFMSSYKDNLLRQVFLLLPEDKGLINASTKPIMIWQIAGEFLLRSPVFGGQMEKNIPGTENIIEEAKAMVNIKDRTRHIYEAVKKRMNDKTEQTIYPDDIQDAWKTKSGNSAEINLILMNLLQKSGVKCFPVLVSTRENGKVNPNFPGIGQVNGVDVLVEDKGNFYLMDASLKFQSFLVPPSNILNREAFLLEQGNMRWVMITDDRPLSRESTDIFAWFKDEDIEGKATARYYDYAKSYKLDTNLQENTKKTDEKETRAIGLTVRSVQQEDANNDMQPLTETTEFLFEPNKSGDFYFINPLFFSSKRINPFIRENRNSDIDFISNQESRFGFTLEIPPGYEIETLPKSLTVRAPDSSFFYKRLITSDSTNIYFSQLFEIKRAFFSKEEYSGVQAFFKYIYGQMADEIVLKKKK
jgi:hypothetical protein